MQPYIKRLNIAGKEDVRALKRCCWLAIGDAVELAKVTDDSSAIASALVGGNYV